MKVIWANEPYPNPFDTVNEMLTYYETNSIFLAGPTPRSDDVQSWRPEALETLKDLGFDGSVFVPEDKNGKWNHSYINQVEWEGLGLRIAGCIVFWVPRDLETMPGFTTNVEWGHYCDTGNVVLGAPVGTPKMKYLYHYADKYGITTAPTLKETLQEAMNLLGDVKGCYV